MSNLQYEYDPKHRHLVILENGKLRGGFKGSFAETRFGELLDSEHKISLMDVSENMRKARVRKLRALWIKQGVDKHRAAILEPYGVESTAQLSIEQLDELIDRFKPESNTPANDHIRRLRSNCLTLMNKMGIYNTSHDWSRVNEFMMNPRIAGKLLYQLSLDELKTLHRKLSSIADKQEQSQAIQKAHLN
jgi:hypothetical protein